MKYLANLRVMLAFLLTALLTVVLVSACNFALGGDETETPPGPAQAAIYAPPENVKALSGGPLQIESAHPGDVSRVELRVSRAGAAEVLVRSDRPTEGVVVQEWLPAEPGVYTIRVKAVNADGSENPVLTRQVEVVASLALVGERATETTAQLVEPQPTEISAPVAAASTPGPVVDDAGAAFVISSSGAEGVSHAPDILHYPPPPPAPGVPPGPTQAELPPFIPPVCDAAEHIGVFAPTTTSRRVFVTEPDDVAPQAVGGTLVHRAWRLQNTGTCTWGPGYELAFYGGRNMGSGGVAFESSFPTEAARRNALIDNNRLIMPEGKPNQTAILEVLLTVPTTPGIHQSYWRMRNPHGVFFGPIMGVTLEIVRDCDFGIYGAPVINKFEILGVGNVFEPTDPANVVARQGEDLVLEWNIINATNFDIVFEDPTGDIQSVSTADPNSRATFPTGELGDHVIILFADNGICTAELQVNIKVVPREGAGFQANVTFASNAPVTTTDANASFAANVKSGTFKVDWQHFDEEVDEVVLHIEHFRKRNVSTCALEDWIGDWLCTESEAWQKVESEKTVQVGSEASGAATLCQDSQNCRDLARNLPIELATTNDHAILLFCPASDAREESGVQFFLEARKAGGPAQPQFSNAVDVQCTPSSGTVGEFSPD